MTFVALFLGVFTVVWFIDNEVRHRRNLKDERRQVVEAYRERIKR